MPVSSLEAHDCTHYLRLIWRLRSTEQLGFELLGISAVGGSNLLRAAKFLSKTLKNAFPKISSWNSKQLLTRCLAWSIPEQGFSAKIGFHDRRVSSPNLPISKISRTAIWRPVAKSAAAGNSAGWLPPKMRHGIKIQGFYYFRGPM